MKISINYQELSKNAISVIFIAGSISGDYVLVLSQSMQTKISKEIKSHNKGSSINKKKIKHTRRLIRNRPLNNLSRKIHSL